MMIHGYEGDGDKLTAVYITDQARNIFNQRFEIRPHGEWIEQRDNYGDPYYECSVCEDAFITLEGTPKENHYNFCPNCGADMRKEGDTDGEHQS